jgi:hypothetical protein
MSECKFKNPACTPLHRCKEERAEFDQLLLAGKPIPDSTLINFRHCVQLIRLAVREKYRLPRFSGYGALVTQMRAERKTPGKKTDAEK